jgi:glycosyltransferase 2 family protein
MFPYRCDNAVSEALITNMQPDDYCGKPSARIGHHLITALKVCLVVGLFWYMIHKGLISLEQLKGLFSAELLPALLMAALMCLTSYLLAAVRQKILLKTIDIHLNLLQSFYIVYVGVFFNNVFPGSTGGDVSRLYLLGKDNRGSISNIAGFAVFDRVVGFSAVAATAAIAVGYTLVWESARLQAVLSGLLWVVLLASLVPVFFFAALFFGRLPVIRSLARRVFALVPKSSSVINFVLTLESFSRRKDVIAWGFAISCLSCVAQLAGIAVLSWFLFGADRIYPALVTAPMVMLSGVVPLTPGNIGGAEYLGSILWDLLGVASGGTVWASWRVVTVLTSLFGGVIYLFKFKGTERQAESEADHSNASVLVPERTETH